MKQGFFFGLVAGSITMLAVVSLASLTGLISAQGSRTVQLRQGWNQLVWTGESQAVDTALAPIADKMPIAYGWQGDSQIFSRYVPGRPDVSSMSQVEKDNAYWLLMSQDFTLPFPTADVQCPEATTCPNCGDWEALAKECTTSYDQCVGGFALCTNDLISCRNDLENCADDFSGQSLCELLDELDELQWANLSTAFAVDCGLALECELQCDLDFRFERDVNAVAAFLRTSPPFDLSMWQLEHCVGPFYHP